MQRGVIFVALAAILLLVDCAAPPLPPDPEYVASLEEWRKDRDERLRSETGWLTLVGLDWLEPGENRFGSDPNNPVVLTAEGMPAHAGSLFLDGETVRMVPSGAIEILVGDEPAGERQLASDDPGPRDLVQLAGMTFYVIRRGDRFGVRIKDPRSPVLAGFQGMDYFPISTALRFDLPFQRYDEPKTIQVPSVLGTTSESLSTGYVEFELEGKTHRLQPMVNSVDDTDLFFVFKDDTSGHETYGAGRFLAAELTDGRVELDFNVAYNPPCVFTPYATCPLPPPGNDVSARIEAGELNFGQH